MRRTRHNARLVVTYKGWSRTKAKPPKPQKEREPVDPAIIAAALDELTARVEKDRKMPGNDRWANRDRTVPANKWSGKK